MEEWFLPGSRPDGLLHRTVTYLAASDSQDAALADHASSVLGAVALPGSSGCSGRMARSGQHSCRSSAVAGTDQGEQAVASIQEEFSRYCQAGDRSAASAAGEGAVVASEGERVVARRFDLLSGETEVVALALGAGGDGMDVASATRTYGEYEVGQRCC